MLARDDELQNIAALANYLREKVIFPHESKVTLRPSLLARSSHSFLAAGEIKESESLGIWRGSLGVTVCSSMHSCPSLLTVARLPLYVVVAPFSVT